MSPFASTDLARCRARITLAARLIVELAVEAKQLDAAGDVVHERLAIVNLKAARDSLDLATRAYYQALHAT